MRGKPAQLALIKQLREQGDMPYRVMVDRDCRIVHASVHGILTSADWLALVRAIRHVCVRNGIFRVLTDNRDLSAGNRPEDHSLMLEAMRLEPPGPGTTVAVVRSPLHPVQTHSVRVLKELGVEARAFVSGIDAERWLTRGDPFGPGAPETMWQTKTGRAALRARKA